ncbi:MAG: hypothetical protein Q7T35_09565 [Nitrosomonas sp.]|nr:hypothetical protein [Nitrosomonas sp.]
MKMLRTVRIGGYEERADRYPYFSLLDSPYSAISRIGLLDAPADSVY